MEKNRAPVVAFDFDKMYPLEPSSMVTVAVMTPPSATDGNPEPAILARAESRVKHSSPPGQAWESKSVKPGGKVGARVGDEVGAGVGVGDGAVVGVEVGW